LSECKKVVVVVLVEPHMDMAMMGFEIILGIMK
jgi:hypothetical protein